MSRVFHVGDHITFPLGAHRVHGTVVEERGPIGARGRRLYQVKVPNDPFDPTTFELAEDEMDIADATNGKNAPLSTSAIMDYFKNGGLISILRSNSGGKDQPRVWLCRDSLGNITHTFYQEYGQVGGQTVPFWTVYADHIFEPERDKVLQYLRSFDLTKPQAEEVIKAVGTAAN